MSPSLTEPSKPSESSLASRPRRLLALIMPARNEEHAVAATLDAVFASTRLPDEIVVADGLSSDRTLERVAAYQGRGPQIRIVANPGVFAGAGRNVAVAATRCEILLFLDFGNLVEPGWIAAMARPFEEDRRVAAVGGLYLPQPASNFEACVAAVQYLDALRFQRLPAAARLRRVPAQIRLGGLGMAVAREVYVGLGGMPDWLRAAEDNLFGRKLLAAGVRPAAALDAVLHHHMRASLKALFLQNLVYARGEARIGQQAGPNKRPLALHLGHAALLAATLAWAPAWSAVVAASWLLAACVIGWRRLARSGLRVGAVGWLWHAPRVVLAKEWGGIAGWLIGRAEWLLARDFRQRCTAYLKDARLGPAGGVS